MQGVLSEILGWAESQPSWQREALRRLVERGALKEEDFSDFIELCKRAHDSPQVDSSNVPPARSAGSGAVATTHPLSSTEAWPKLAAPVTLESIDRVTNVNALARDSSLDFGGRGLTVVYGDNGSGKSGFARILKRACRARAHGGPLRTNVFAPAPSDLPRARIRFKVGERSQEFCWVESGPLHSQLGAVSFLDDECAAVHLDAENEVAYRPYGLDLLEDLAGACRKVRETLSQELADLRGRNPARLEIPEIAAKTEVARALAGLDARASLATFERLANVGEREGRRLAELRRDLDEAPRSAMARIQDQVDRCQKLSRLVETAEAVVGDAAWEEFRQAQDDALSKRRAAELSASALFSGEPLNGVGGEIWRALWEAARAYSETAAYPAELFPVTTEGAACVLCQQSLGADAAERFRRFEAFISEGAQRAAVEAGSALDTRAEEIKALGIVPANWRRAVADLRSIEPTLAGTARRFLASARWRRWALLRSYFGETPLPEPGTLPPTPLPKLKAVIETACRRRSGLVTASQATDRSNLDRERRELESRLWLRRVLPEVQREIDRRKKIERLEAAYRDADSTPVTRKSTELARLLLTDKLVDRFTSELERLRVQSVRAELQPISGRYGAPRYQIHLKGAHDRGVRCGDVLSEGERRVVALAGFLAELATAEEHSAVVLDDPVSSLDHRWRRLVAERLVEEAADRQVIVFTHDLVFYLLLKREAEYLGLPLVERQLRRQSRGTGVMVGDVPWIAMRTNQRLGWLKQKLQESEKVLLSHGSAMWEPLARDLYGSLRETWERAVEQDLLAGVVERFGDEVKTKSLRKVTDFSDEDYNTLHRAMARCSALMRGHDEAAAINEPVPAPDEVQRDIAELEQWVAAIRQRRK